MAKAISQDLNDLGFVVGKEFVDGPRNSGRTTRLVKDALHQVDFMAPDDEIWVVFHTWEMAKLTAERAGSKLAREMRLHPDTARFGPKLQQHPLMPNSTLTQRWLTQQGSVRYHLSFDDRIIHFVSIEALENQLRGVRLRYDPAIYFDHVCYEFGYIQNASFDVYSLLRESV